MRRSSSTAKVLLQTEFTGGHHESPRPTPAWLHRDLMWGDADTAIVGNRDRFPSTQLSLIRGRRGRAARHGAGGGALLEWAVFEAYDLAEGERPSYAELACRHTDATAA